VQPERLARLLFQLPRQSRVFTKLAPENQWSWQEILLNKSNYLLEVLTWQKTKDAQKRNPSKAPKIFIPDFMPKQETQTAINKDSELHDSKSIDAILSKPRQNK